MLKKSKSFTMTVAATALFSVLSVSAAADSVTELPVKNISGDLAVLAVQAQNNGWEIVASGQNNSIEMKKSLTATRVLSGVHNRWKRVTDSVDATAVATVSDGKIIISSSTPIKNPRHQQQFDEAVASLEKGWETGTLTASAQ